MTELLEMALWPTSPKASFDRMLTIHDLHLFQSERIVWLCEELQIPYLLRLYQHAPLLSPPLLKALTPFGTPLPP